MTKIRLKRYVPQIDERDCGVAALSMIVNQYGSNFSLARLREEAKTDLEGTTALGIVKAANKLGFETRAIARYPTTDFETLTDIQKGLVSYAKTQGVKEYG